MREWIKKTGAALISAAALAFCVPAVSAVLPGSITAQATDSAVYTVKVESGYLALRNAKAYDSANEIGKLYTGDTVTVQDTSDSTYWYVYSTSLNKNGYVNKNYLVESESTTPVAESVVVPAYTVSVSDGYLALRNAKATDSSNEIGAIYNGEKVLVTDSTVSGDFWYVYAPTLSKMGYVNKNYLVSGAQLTVSAYTYTASVTSGYLALRTAQAYDSANEIGKLYTGDTVEVVSANEGAQYWYAYAPSLGKFGYVNKDYLVYGIVSSSSTTMTVKVSSGYLALRTAKAYDSSNEIGKLYTGDKVQVTDTSDSQYWYVYAPSLDKYGYVNKDYLY